MPHMRSKRSSGGSARGGTLGGRIALAMAGRVHPEILYRLAAKDPYPWGYVPVRLRTPDSSCQLDLFPPEVGPELGPGSSLGEVTQARSGRAR